MSLYLIGIDWKKASLDSREAVIGKRKLIIDFCIRNFPQAPSIFSTCNRFEIYGISRDDLEAGNNIDSFLSQFSEFSLYGYVKTGHNAVYRHVLRVAAGLESQLKGEPQIWEQLNNWSSQPGIPDSLEQLLCEVLALAQDIRLRSGLCRMESNIAVLALDDLRRKVGGGRALKVIVVGTGKIARVFAAIKSEGVILYFTSRKNHLRAKELAVSARGYALTIEDLPSALSDADALICATSSPHYILEHVDFRGATLLRREPLYIYDLASPRDINPEVGRINNIVLKNMDSLSLAFQAHDNKIRTNLDLAEYLVGETIREQKGIFYEQNSKDWHPAESLSLKAG